MNTLSTSRIYKISAIISYIIGYIYIKYVVCISEFGIYRSAWIVAFAVVFILWTEAFAYLTGNTYKKIKEQGNAIAEPIILIACILFQSIAISIWTLHHDWELYQILIWHGTIIYYVTSRMGRLAAGRSGIFFLIDAFSGAVVIPLSNFFLRVKKLFGNERWLLEECDENDDIIEINSDEGDKEEADDITIEKKHIRKADFGMIIFSVIVAIVVCAIAISQLVSVSDTFAGIGNSINDFFESILSADLFEYFFTEIFLFFIISIPFGCWLYALVAGAIQKDQLIPSSKKLEEETEGFHTLPSYSAYIIIGSVCVLYGIFFISAFVDILNGNSALTAHEACVDAVGSFWQLIKVVILNMAVMFASCFFSKKALWTEKGTRILATLLFVFALAFALLAAWNLVGVYIAVYGITPRRILSSWVVVNIITWCVLILIRLYKKISAAQIGIIFAVISFSIITCAKF